MDTENSYNNALDYLYGFVDYSLKHTSELVKAEFNLDRMFDLMKLLGNPEHNYPILHVAGTKGKGSTSAFLACALKQAGFTTGLYTSPHLQDFCERIQINGKPVSHSELADLVEYIKPEVEKIPFITTFELTTALAFLYFARKGVNVAVIEVGLGGRLDATNIVQPLVSIITSLSMDHTAVLGNTLELIAGEKAGIVKEGIPVVSSPQKKEALLVLEKIAQQRSSKLFLVGKDWMYSSGSRSLQGQDMEVWQPGGEHVKLYIRMLGAHQVQNAATAYAGLQVANQSGLKITNANIQQGFSQTFWPARFEIARAEPPVIMDSAHNQDSANKLHDTLREYFPGRKVILIFGASEDKDVAGMFKEWKPCLSRIILTHADHPRALDPGQLAILAQDNGIPCEIVFPVEAALEKALSISAETGEIVLSAGSMFVSAEVRTAWQKIQAGL
ncbi:MAG: folylpolyglutamate synthase/dihydrofolate synthase family protein [Chloroflexota bacterium]